MRTRRFWRPGHLIAGATLLVSVFRTTAGAQIGPENILPPVLPWGGISQERALPPGHPWATPCEQAMLLRTPRLDETVAWLEKLVAAAPELQLVRMGSSGEGRELILVVASLERAFSPAELAATGKPTLFAQAGIHAGEIDGKDAGLMLLRDMTVLGTRRALLEKANFLFVPVFNVDGHERFSAYGRINQRGPVELGWRTTARNLNLNRDYTKLDAPEMRAMVRALQQWPVDLYVDLHVTDGIDYQYDITFGFNDSRCLSPSIGRWLEDVLEPAVTRDLKAAGHIPGPLIFARDGRDLSRGMVYWPASPRFSHGYGDARHLATVLVENHSLKPYPQRVLGTHVLLESMLQLLGEQGASLRRATAEDRALRSPEVTLDWGPEPGDPEPIEFLGIRSEQVDSPVSGAPVIRWTGEPITLSVPYLALTAAKASASRPQAYWIPPERSDLVERLGLHGITWRRTPREVTLEAEVYRFEEVHLGEAPYEGRVMVTARAVRESREVTLPVGSIRVSTDQPLGTLAMILLEPDGVDSFFQWGFLHEILQETEYFEAYAMEPLGRVLLEQDATLRAAFEQKLAEDEAFRSSPRARLRWLYERSPYFDDHYLVYPVVREPAVGPR